MLKALIVIDCDCCNEQFHYARVTRCQDWYVDVSALTTMACDYYDWTEVNKGKYHYCPNCSSDIENMYDHAH